MGTWLTDDVESATAAEANFPVFKFRPQLRQITAVCGMAAAQAGHFLFETGVSGAVGNGGGGGACGTGEGVSRTTGGAATCSGDGTVISLPQEGHSNDIPAPSSSTVRDCPQAEQLKLMSATVSFPFEMRRGRAETNQRWLSVSRLSFPVL